MRRLVSVSIVALMLTLLFVPVSKVSAMSGDSTVYITKTGSCYHADGCSSLRRSKIATSLSDAVSRGYSPCSKCHPGSLDQASAPTTTSAPAASTPAIAQTENKAVAQNVAPSGWECIYNEAYYRAHYADVNAAYTDSDSIFQHFKTSGMKEGRRGCEEFDVTSYRNKNADLNAAFGDDLPKYYYHYMSTGKAEGRSGK